MPSPVGGEAWESRRSDFGICDVQQIEEAKISAPQVMIYVWFCKDLLSMHRVD